MYWGVQMYGFYSFDISSALAERRLENKAADNWVAQCGFVRAQRYATAAFPDLNVKVSPLLFGWSEQRADIREMWKHCPVRIHTFHEQRVCNYYRAQPV
jgi:hypothetical protein